MPLQLRRNTQGFWESLNPVPLRGEPIFAHDTNILKIGDGTSTYLILPAIGGVDTNVPEWFEASGVPSNGLGKNGDYYINTANGDLYVRTAGTWGVRGSVAAATGDRHYVHDQAIPSALWTINHNLGKFPAITVVDSANTEIEGEITHVSSSQCTATFSAAFSGKAYCN